MSGSSQPSTTTPRSPLEFEQTQYNAIKKILTDNIKKLANYESRRNLPRDPKEKEDRVSEYKTELVGNYNNYLAYVQLFYTTFDLTSQFKINETVEILKIKVKNSLKILNLDIVLPQNFEKIDINTVKPLELNLNNTNDTASASSSTHNIQEGGEKQNNSDLDDNSEIQEDIIVQGVQIDTDTPEEEQSNLTAQNTQNNTNQTLTMALTPGDILKGIPDFDPKSQDSIKVFIAQVDLMYVLAPNSGDTILAIAKAKLVTANKLSTITDKTWAQIKADIKLKYKTQMSFEVAQEKLLSLQQGQKESHETYANRVRSLLDALNSTTINDNADIQHSNRAMNESLAIRKYKQNIFDRELRGMALSVDHSNLSDAIAHASPKYEQLIASNLHKKDQDKNEQEKKEPEVEKNNKNTNKQTHFKNNQKKTEHQNKNKNNSTQCTHCKKWNHQSERCFFRPGGPGYNKSNNIEQTKNTNTAAAMAQPANQSEQIATTSSVPQQQVQSIALQPYHFLGN